MASSWKQNSFRKLSTWMVCSLLVCWDSPVSASKPTYEWQDPATNEGLECEQCPPGTFVAQHCTKERPTRCEACPRLHYTQYWNYLEKCLYCNNICSGLEVTARPCNATHDQVCQCKPGYYWDHPSDSCLPHSTCPPGSGIDRPGTPHQDATCAECPPGTFSNSSVGECQLHTNCSARGLELNVPGNQFHDALCTACKLNQSSRTRSGSQDCKQAFIDYEVSKTTLPEELLYLKQVLEHDSQPKDSAKTHLQLQAEIYSYLSKIQNTPTEASVTKDLLTAFRCLKWAFGSRHTQKAVEPSPAPYSRPAILRSRQRQSGRVRFAPCRKALIRMVLAPAASRLLGQPQHSWRGAAAH